MLDPAAEWAELIVATLADAGVTDLAISPGSRSAPLVLAAVRDGRLALHDIIDERAAAFFALGQARLRGRPTACLCTSGTAPAHWLPAVVEADLARLPLVLISADRPLELHGCSAPQTVEQVGLFGRFVRAFFDLGLPNAAAALGARRQVAQAVAATIGPLPGPVHLNARFAKPLEPRPASDGERADSERVRAARRAPASVHRAERRLPSESALDWLAARIDASARGALVCGPLPAWDGGGERLIALAEHLGWPLIAEATSQLRGRALAGELWASSRRAPAPELVVRFGAPPTSTAIGRWMLGGARIIVAEHGWPDPDGGAELVEGSAGDVAAGLLARTQPRPASEFGRSLHALEREADQTIARVVDGSEQLTEPRISRIVAAAGTGPLAVGNSLAVRMLDAFAGRALAGRAVLSQRGANGIDGLVAGAAGAAASAPGRVTLLLGDVSLAHDCGSLALCRGRALTIVVVDNDGGRIFDSLPLVGAPGAAAAMNHFRTPPRIDWAQLAGAFGLQHCRATTPAELTAALAVPVDGALLVEARAAQSIDVVLP
jgi:2-succinyl-5-enolpyruvyl-6-hydroxy-3-cyclohexene-1-carboxylate synthase